MKNPNTREIPSREENPNGLHKRYIVAKTRGKLDENAEYFVLRLDEDGKDINHVRACRRAISVYADNIQNHIPKLADELRKRYPVDKEFSEANPLMQLQRLYREMKTYKDMLNSMQQAANFQLLFSEGERTSIEHIKSELVMKLNFITDVIGEFF